MNIIERAKQSKRRLSQSTERRLSDAKINRIYTEAEINAILNFLRSVTPEDFEVAVEEGIIGFDISPTELSDLPDPVAEAIFKARLSEKEGTKRRINIQVPDLEVNSKSIDLIVPGFQPISVNVLSKEGVWVIDAIERRRKPKETPQE